MPRACRNVNEPLRMRVMHISLLGDTWLTRGLKPPELVAAVHAYFIVDRNNYLN